ncbi:MAG: serine/threonine protein kinase [Candidatus Saganbacteria bacterium]|nr:serine/threonine protein kinase [Candidatus Saganbacteria bacterium]
MERFLKSRYKIGDKISENPFSVTYQGSFIGTDKPVIIKIYKRGTLNSGLIKRMKQKVRELSLINHHGIAKLLDGDYGWQGFYYVREYVKGSSLAEILDSNQEIGIDKAATIIEEACAALAVVHARGIIHGELKPSNIFIGSKGVLRLTDFVIEGEIKDAMPQKVVAVLGEGAYTSPEELVGKPASASSDIYVLGIILYEMLCPKESLNKKELFNKFNKLKNPCLVKHETVAFLPRYLQDILVKALQRDPLLRFKNIAQFRESLEKKALVLAPNPTEEFVTIFENTVSRYGEDEIEKESESLKDLGRVRIRWSKEKHRNWILAAVLAAAVFSGLFYAFLFGR